MYTAKNIPTVSELMEKVRKLCMFAFAAKWVGNKPDSVVRQRTSKCSLIKCLIYISTQHVN